ncbi:MAG: hypothetical protein ACTSQJ_14685, partial [Promethearchaeota archaeon]
NIRNLSKYDRIVGVAKTPEEFLKLIKYYRIEENVLFFQEYLGKFNKIYKVYVVDRWAVSIIAHNRLLEKSKLSPAELVHIRIPIEKQLKRRIVRLGRKLGMPVFGVDYILTNDRVPYIIDINDFPSFRHIPEAVSLICDHIYNIISTRELYYKSLAKAKVY